MDYIQPWGGVSFIRSSSEVWSQILKWGQCGRVLRWQGLESDTFAFEHQVGYLLHDVILDKSFDFNKL